MNEIVPSGGSNATKSRLEAMSLMLSERLAAEDVEPQYRTEMEMFQKAILGDEGALDKLILGLADIKETAPDGSILPSFREEYGDPVEIAKKALLRSIYGDISALHTLGRQHLDAKERELAGPNPSPLESMQAQQAAICWLQLYHYEKKYADRLNVQPQDNLGFQKEEFYHKQVARAQRRLETALKTLAQVRRLQLPTVQINVADKQVNIGSGQVSVKEAQVNVLAVSENEEE